MNNAHMSRAAPPIEHGVILAMQLKIRIIREKFTKGTLHLTRLQHIRLFVNLGIQMTL